MTPRAAVFVFHAIVPAERLAEVPADERPYALAPEDFRAYLLAARLSSRRAVPVGTLPSELGALCYGLTFDDGHASDYTEAFPVLHELGLRATFFVVPTLVDTPGFVRWDQLREMVAAGMEVGSHSLTHPFMDHLDVAGLRREFGDSKAMLEDRLGTPVRCASLPRGWPAPHTEPVLAELGYRVFCTSRVGWWHPGDRPLAMPRVRASADLSVERFVAIVDGAPRALWSIQAVEAAKNAVKACVGRRGWNRIRTPFLRLRYTMEVR
jgi:peptidoglycan/xylan/chitin deacetylase (PgdA/CDA1 family)